MSFFKFLSGMLFLSLVFNAVDDVGTKLCEEPSVFEGKDAFLLLLIVVVIYGLGWISCSEHNDC